MTLASSEAVPPDRAHPSRDLRWSPVLTISLVGTCVVVAYASLAYLQILVLNPLAAVPNKSLEAIWGEVVRFQGEHDGPTAFVTLALGPLLAFGLLFCASVWLRKRPWLVAASYLTLLVFGTPAYALASFSPGMNLADTFGIDGGDYSPWAEPLYVTSLIALLALMTIGLGALVLAARSRNHSITLRHKRD